MVENLAAFGLVLAVGDSLEGQVKVTGSWTALQSERLGTIAVAGPGRYTECPGRGTGGRGRDEPQIDRAPPGEMSDGRHFGTSLLPGLLSRSSAEIPEGLYSELLKAISDKNANVRQNVLSLLYKFPQKIDEMVPVLTRIANTDTDVTTRMRAVSNLGYGVVQLDSASPIFRQIVQTLCQAAEKDASFYVREVSINHLEKLAARDDHALRALVRATGDEVESTRNKAAAALKRLGHEMLDK